MLELTSYEMFQSGPEQVTPYLGHVFGQSSFVQPIYCAQLPAKETFKTTGNYCIQNYIKWYV